MKKIYSLLALVALGASFAVVGCGGDDDPKSPSSSGGDAGETSTGGTSSGGTGGTSSGGTDPGTGGDGGNMGGGGLGGGGAGN